MNALALWLAVAPVLGLAGEYRGALDVSDRTEVRLRAPGDPTTAGNPGSTPNPADVLPSFDLENVPTARMVVSTRRTDFTASYSPRLTLRSIGHDVPRELLHSARLAAAWRAHRLRLELAEDGSYGDYSFASLAVPLTQTGVPSTNVQPPQLKAIKYGSTRTTLSTEVRASRRDRVTTALSYQVSGAVHTGEFIDQSTVPLQYGPTAEITHTHALTRRDDVGWSVQGNRTDFLRTTGAPPGTTVAQPDGASYVLLQEEQLYGHRFTRHLNGQIGAGVSAVRAENKDNPDGTWSANPAALATLTESLLSRDGRLDLSAAAHLGPFINRLTATVDQRIDASATASWIRRDVTLTLSGGTAHSVPASASNNTHLWFGSFVAAYRVTKVVELDAGARVAWQSTIQSEAAGATPAAANTNLDVLQKVVFLAMMLRAPTTRF